MSATAVLAWANSRGSSLLLAVVDDDEDRSPAAIDGLLLCFFAALALCVIQGQFSAIRSGLPLSFYQSAQLAYLLLHILISPFQCLPSSTLAN